MLPQVHITQIIFKWEETGTLCGTAQHLSAMPDKEQLKNCAQTHLSVKRRLAFIMS